MKRTVVIAIFSLFIVSCQSATEEDASPEPQAEVEMEESRERSIYSGRVDASESTIRFDGGSSVVNHSGRFDDFTVRFKLDDEDPSDFTKATLAASINVDSIYTDSEGLSRHLLAEDFLDAATYPQARFRSTAIILAENGSYEIIGDITVKGTTKNVSMNAEIGDSAMDIQYQLPRKEFGVGNDSYGDKILDEFVPITITLIFDYMDSADVEEIEDMEEVVNEEAAEEETEDSEE